MITMSVLAVAAGLLALLVGQNVRVIKQFERGVVYRFGRVQPQVRGPGLTTLLPVADRLQKVNMQIITLPVPAQDDLTCDNVTVRVDAVICISMSPTRSGPRSTCRTTGPPSAQVAQTSLRSIIGKRAISMTCSPTAST